MQIKTYTWKSYTFLIVSIFVTMNLFLFTPILDRAGVEYVVPFAYFILTSAVIAIILAVISFCSQSEKKMLAIIGLCFTLFNTAVILFCLWFGYHFT
ncbi:MULTISPECIES: hypothetical protein [Bacillus cereus group]|uniref:Uncharacterized protein n=1 Tax=Bacillus thuringiensis serovar sooncheon TaxID=180891 RepID=A0A9Q5SMW8_BACTU|nr:MULTISPECIES: hypothetical protein [Bacillus cereus group]OTW73346.1 hypothetical protein BK707_03165 [Bacillus thuringiensis serovar coreanensis]OTX50867.1 hypothetical protein BK724_05635 [Bacillus thuringiensis serovar sooncheon]OTX56711.1 hypothetical protein BK725_08915 [Bacillus thuringiensis serovar guiyangiensis]OTX71121.1 hypothetical protein BK727_07870 [Bacillus thuringiensis serovar roskildiensis]